MSKVDKGWFGQLLDFLVEIYRISRGSPHLKFSILLIIVGTGLLAGHNWIVEITLHLFGMATDARGAPISSFWENATKALGAVLAIFGVIIGIWALRRISPPVLRNYIGFSIPDGFTFEQMAQKIVGEDGINFGDLETKHLAMAMNSDEIAAESVHEALSMLPDHINGEEFPMVEVHVVGNKYFYKRIENGK